MGDLDRINDAPSMDPRTLKLLHQLLNPLVPRQAISVINRPEEELKASREVFQAVDKVLAHRALELLTAAASFVAPLEGARFLVWVARLRDSKDEKYRNAKERVTAAAEELRCATASEIPMTFEQLVTAFRGSYEMPVSWAVQIEAPEGDSRLSSDPVPGQPQRPLGPLPPLR